MLGKHNFPSSKVVGLGFVTCNCIFIKVKLIQFNKCLLFIDFVGDLNEICLNWLKYYVLRNITEWLIIHCCTETLLIPTYKEYRN
jgi:hypothetical protein